MQDIWSAWKTGTVLNIADEEFLAKIRDSHVFMASSPATRPELSVYLWAYKERLMSGASTSEDTFCWKNMEELLKITTIQQPKCSQKIVGSKVGARLAENVNDQDSSVAEESSMATSPRSEAKVQTILEQMVIAFGLQLCHTPTASIGHSTTTAMSESQPTLKIHLLISPPIFSLSSPDPPNLTITATLNHDKPTARYTWPSIFHLEVAQVRHDFYCVDLGLSSDSNLDYKKSRTNGTGNLKRRQTSEHHLPSNRK
ncbi:hypothetical protein AC578_8859 [Pseudocercospora eumusae]|uniref:Uncharacterized protein n=1 Tax=Pseudocercospora eumusae TaxID=321146 RepID=A0A139H5N0_9PEZI|nr:hypothetical protein AC578_8859 [Pseudocercospora eumusae]